MCRVKVVDLYTEVVTLGCGVLALNEVQLLITDAQPAYREGEAWSGDLPHPEKVFVEVHRLVEVVGVDAYVGETLRAHGLAGEAPGLGRAPRADQH